MQRDIKLYSPDERQADSERARQGAREAERQAGTSSTDYACACAGARVRTREEEAQDRQTIAALMAYAREGGLPDTPPMRAYCLRLLAAGMDARVLWDVMDETMMAPRPSWHYYAAIMRRLQAAGIQTYAAWLRRQELHRRMVDLDE